jgi:hypothetical protein
MAETAAHIIDHVLPSVPIRQVVLTVPRRIRWVLHHDRKMVSGVLRVFLRALRTTLCKHSPDAPKGSSLGAVSFLHRAGASMNVHSHFHTVICDGVFSVAEDGQAIFHPASLLDEDAFHTLQETVRKRILRYLVRHGALDEMDADDMMRWEHGGGFSLHGKVRIKENDRDGQERLLRYTARPSFALERLARWDEERLVYDFQRPRPDGQTHQVFTPMEFMQRLSELIPPPWINLVRYSGVLAPNAKLRKKVVALAGPSAAVKLRQIDAAEKMQLDDPDALDEAGRKKRLSWALLMARLFEFFPLLCPKCGNSMKIVGFIMEPTSIQKVLNHLDLPTEIPTLHPSRAPPQAEMDFSQDYQDYVEDSV